MTGHSTNPVPVEDRGRLVVSVTAVVYVLAWVAGLLIAPSGPAATDPAGRVRAYYAEHGPAVLTQSLLIHGLAGCCLLVLAWTLPRVRGGASSQSAIEASTANAVRSWRWWVQVTGSVAAVVSLTQVGFAIVATRGAESHPAQHSQQWLAAINHADTVKLVFIAAFVAGVGALLRADDPGTPRGTRWLGWLGYLLVPLLVLGGGAFVFDDTGITPALTVALTVSLPLLLAWAGLLAATQLPRRRLTPHQTPSTASPSNGR